MKIITIGDLHGLTTWQRAADLKLLFDTPDKITPVCDKYIFLGDYVDSFDISNIDIFNNLTNIINLKKKYPNHIVLLIGNHDMQYLYSYDKCGCSGYRPMMYIDLHELFNANKSLFQVAFQIGDTIWTHAGITNWWHKNKYLTYFDDAENKRFNILDKDNELSSNLNNLLFYDVIDVLMTVGYSRGGWSHTGGVLWADKKELMAHSLNGYNQIIGHTQLKEITTVNTKDNENTLVFCDCLPNKEEFYEFLI